MLGDILVILSLQVDRNVLQGLENFDSPTALKLMHEGPSEYPFASAMAKIHECTAWVIKRIMPRFWVLILLSSL